eukprot:TRINITY_DN4955_c0_g1_i1.p1 TRINITY_DN4955_c0_g1~~TRINITY_DN4955_c0_g1_i1.p1  ORF type:complete len:293 (-),score=65.06 TRINITY_DN4955_c0_g1_i1:35-814(-)
MGVIDWSMDVLILSAWAAPIVLIVISAGLFYGGFFRQYHVADTRVGDFLAVFREIIGDYSEFGTNLTQEWDALRKEFPDGRPFSMFLDDAEALENRSKGRAVYGVLLDRPTAAHRSSVELFLNNNQGYKQRELPKVDGVMLEYTYKGWLSQLMLRTRLLPKLVRFAVDQKHLRREAIVGVLQVFNPSAVTRRLPKTTLKSTRVEVFIPFGEMSFQYFLASSQAPKLRKEHGIALKVEDIHDPFIPVSYTHLTLPTIYSV